MFGMYLSLYYGSAILSHPAFSWIHYETDLLVLSSQVFIHPTPRFSCWGLWEEAMVVPQGHLGTSMLLLPLASPISILRPALYPFKERSTDMCNMVVNPIIWNFKPPDARCIASPKR